MTLVIANTSRSDNGTYRCSVNIVDDPPPTAFDDAILSVIYLDKPVLISFDTPVMEGDTVEMSCIANANPSPTYTFLRDGEVQQSWASSTFMIQSVSRVNNGSYVCRASNSAGTETSDSRTLDVQYLPECPCTDYKFANPGENVTIAPKCVANPTDIDYQWSSVPNVTDLDSNEATFTFTVSKEFGTEYNITVIANNSIGSTTESVIVIVAAPCSLSCQNGGTCQIVNDTEKCVCPTGFEGQYCQHNKTHNITTILPTPTPPPTTPTPKSKSVIGNCTIIIYPNPAKEGESVDIECSSENSNPTPMITLFKDENKIEYVNGTKLTFNIKSMKKSDEGDYYCIATNIAGSRTSDKIKLTMKLNIWIIATVHINHVIQQQKQQQEHKN
ncbi:neurotrimin-like [Anneissia japonica]|uniref:neurotrimin-like n=1 Tax=Anneissia japonica TaxID=1529436 RepID=UPI001425579A|nr:neurotrimin-like [Anneissia japonica]